MKDEKKINVGYYAVIPASIRYDKTLPPNAKLLYGEITALCNQSGQCWATNRYFSELYQVSIVTISRWISMLEKANYIILIFEKTTGNTMEVQRKIAIKENCLVVNAPIQNSQAPLTKQSTPLNKIVMPPIQNNQAPLTELLSPLDEIVKDNNTSNIKYNNTSNITSNNNLTDSQSRGEDRRNIYEFEENSEDNQANELFLSEEATFYKETLYERLNKAMEEDLDTNWMSFERRFKNIVEESCACGKLVINQHDVRIEDWLSAMMYYAKDPSGNSIANMFATIDNAKNIKNKFAYTVSTLYNKAKVEGQ